MSNPLCVAAAKLQIILVLDQYLKSGNELKKEKFVVVDGEIPHYHVFLLNTMNES